MEGRRIVQVISLLASYSAAIALIYFYCRAQRKQGRAYVIAPILYFIHSSVFYTCVFLDVFNVIDIVFFSTWSAGVSLHAIITIIVTAYAAVKQSRWLIY